MADKVLMFRAPRATAPSLSDAISAEQRGDIDKAVEMYARILSVSNDPSAAINLGTIAYNCRDYEKAATLYRRATEMAPGYALAWFNLGNALDEMQCRHMATEAYERALKIDPKYGDAHYNLGLLWNRSGEHRKALKHWKAYLKIDQTSQHAERARTMVKQIMAAERLQVRVRT
jgi:tetratricopeptide (TPR) repeat protein